MFGSNRPPISLTGNITVTAVLKPGPGVIRTGGFKLTANLTFSYLDADLPTTFNESSLVINRYEGEFQELPTALNVDANTATTAGITQFPHWTRLGQFAPGASRG